MLRRFTARGMGMKLYTIFLAVLAAALPLCADCNKAINSKGMISPRGTVESADNVCPLSIAEKGGLFLRHTWSPFNMVAAAGSAGIWQATQSSHEGFGQGWEAYGSRFGAAMANRESGDFFKTFVLSSALRMDPRYFRKGSGSAGSRFGYAISRVLVGRTDAGHSTFNAPEILGNVASAGLSNVYYPESDRTASRTMATAALNIAADAGWNVLKEFGPEIRRVFHREPKDSPSKPADQTPGYNNVPRP
jgi:hypothetical protein